MLKLTNLEFSEVLEQGNYTHISGGDTTNDIPVFFYIGTSPCESEPWNLYGSDGELLKDIDDEALYRCLSSHSYDLTDFGDIKLNP